MKKFVVLYHAPTDAMDKITVNATPEQQAKGMEMWMQWAKKYADNIVELGSPLINGQRITHEGRITPSDKDVTGYSIMQAKDVDELMSMMDAHPHISGWSTGATIEVHEVRPLPGM